MTLTIAQTTMDMGRIAAGIIARAVEEKPTLVLGLATGSTPIRVYHELVRLHEQRELDLSGVRTFNLDEYLGLRPDHSLSYRYFMDTHFFERVNIPAHHIHALDGLVEDPDAECRRYESAIRAAGGIDLQLLGIGVNGHIGFNEPGTPFESATHVALLSATTIAQNSDGRFFKNLDEVPGRALTLGLATIMGARTIVVVANGPRKADAVARAIEGPVTPDVPASLLQRHPAVAWIIERDAAVGLTRSK